MEGHNSNNSKVVEDMNRPTQGRNPGTLRVVLNYEPVLFLYLSRRTTDDENINSQESNY